MYEGQRFSHQWEGTITVLLFVFVLQQDAC